MENKDKLRQGAPKSRAVVRYCGCSTDKRHEGFFELLKEIKQGLKELKSERTAHRKLLAAARSKRTSYQSSFPDKDDTRYLADNTSKPPPLSPTLNGPEDAIRFCEEFFRRLIKKGLQEEVHLLTLDAKNRVIRAHQVTVGILTSATVHPREVFRPAILDAARAIILVHNHPSGVPDPSEEDLKATKVIEASGKSLGIPLLDHIIVASEGSRSIMDWSTKSLFA